MPQSANQTYVLYADFDNVGGLKVKAPVKEAGVVIGRVADIRLNPKTYRARVTLNIDKAYQLSDDASASILTAGLLGEQYIGMLQGGSETNLAPGGTITITSSAMVLEQLIGKFMTGFTEKRRQIRRADGASATGKPAGSGATRPASLTDGKTMKKLLALCCLLFGLSAVAHAAGDAPLM